MYKLSNYLHICILRIVFVVSGCISLFGQAPSFLGGLGQELAFYPLAVGLAIWLTGIIVFQEKVYFPRAYSFYSLIFMLIWLLITGLANFTNMMVVTFKGTTGITRFVIQYGTMIFYFLSAFYIYNVFCKFSLSKEKMSILVEKAILLSAYIMAIYSFFEITSLLGQDYCREIVNSIDAFFRNDEVQGDIFAYVRIRSLTAEASYFGMYCGVVMPWLALRAFDNTLSPIKKIFNIVFFVYYIVLITFSASRTAYFILLIEFLCLIICYRKEILRNFISSVVKVLFFLLLAIGVLMWTISSSDIVEIDVLDIFLSFMDGSNNTYSLSNIARIGSQWAGWYMFLDNPFFGVGYGQYPFYYTDYVPSWAWISYEVQKWSLNIPGSVMTPSHGIYTRLLAEAGIIGMLSWLFILFSVLWEINKSDIELNKKRCYLISIVALLLFGLNIDAFRIFYYWVLLGFTWCMENTFKSLSDV